VQLRAERRDESRSFHFEAMKILTGNGKRVQTSTRDHGESHLVQLAQQGRIK
jgi:hypothetical protein